MTGEDPRRRWWILAVVALAQLMAVLDATIVSIALPSAQRDLGFDDAHRQWVVTAYTLAFGSLLLLGGRISDIAGRKRTFIGGLLGFAGASALGGAAPSFEVLIFARALQGAFAALLAPAALSTITHVFAGSPDRGKAFGVYAATAGGGGSIGLVLGGLLTEYMGWRWCMYVNLALALPAAVAASGLLVNRRAQDRPGIDIPGVLTASAGLFALVYGLANAGRDSWTAPATIGCLAAFAVALVAFIAIESRVSDPLLPLRIVVDRVRGTSFFAIGVAMGTIYGTTLCLSFYVQQVLDLSPVQAGLAFLPQSGMMMCTGIFVNTVLMPRVGPRPLLPSGMAVGAAGLVYLTFIDVGSSYWTGVLPGIVLLSLGMAQVMSPSVFAATLHVPRRDIGVTSAMVNTSKQIGGSIGTALLATVAASATSNFVTAGSGRASAEAAVHGYTVAFWVGASILVVSVLITALALRDVTVQHRAVEQTAAPATDAA